MTEKSKAKSNQATTQNPPTQPAPPPTQPAPPPTQPAPQPGKAAVDQNQNVETDAYVPTYKVKPEFKEAILKAIGKHPFNQISSIMSAVNVEVIDHNTLTQIINVLGNFPYVEIAPILGNVSAYVEQIVED